MRSICPIAGVESRSLIKDCSGSSSAKITVMDLDRLIIATYISAQYMQLLLPHARPEGYQTEALFTRSLFERRSFVHNSSDGVLGSRDQCKSRTGPIITPTKMRNSLVMLTVDKKSSDDLCMLTLVSGCGVMGSRDKNVTLPQQ